MTKGGACGGGAYLSGRTDGDADGVRGDCAKGGGDGEGGSSGDGEGGSSGEGGTAGGSQHIAQCTGWRGTNGRSATSGVAA